MPRMSKRIILISGAAIIALFAAMIVEFAPRIVWNASPSAPQGLYLIAEMTPEVGEYVLIEPSNVVKTVIVERRYLPSDIPLIKRIVALSDVNICRHDARVFVDGMHVADALEVDSLGRPMPRWSGCFTLQVDEVFLLNGHKRSLDGRYFGATKKSQIIGVARPIFVREASK